MKTAPHTPAGTFSPSRRGEGDHGAVFAPVFSSRRVRGAEARVAIRG